MGKEIILCTLYVNVESYIIYKVFQSEGSKNSLTAKAERSGSYHVIANNSTRLGLLQSSRKSFHVHT